MDGKKIENGKKNRFFNKKNAYQPIGRDAINRVSTATVTKTKRPPLRKRNGHRYENETATLTKSITAHHTRSSSDIHGDRIDENRLRISKCRIQQAIRLYV